jgi:hypothetical protein
MSSESKDLFKARELLGKFEAEMGLADRLVHLVGGLSLLSAVREDAASFHEGQIASNIALAYARKAGTEVESLLSREHMIDSETLLFWYNVFFAFDRAGFPLPQDVAQTSSNLFTKLIEWLDSVISPATREKLIDQLKASKPENDI